MRRGAFAALALVAAVLLGAAAPARAQSTNDLLIRLDSYESELRRLTARVEELEFRLRQQAGEADARVRDLEFRIIELEGGDPTAAFRDGDAAAPAPAPAPAIAAPAAPADAATGRAPAPRPLGVLRSPVDRAEQVAFDAAVADLAALGPTDGQRSVDAFLARYPASELAPDAYLALGEAFAAENRNQEAARRFLTGFREHETAPAAPELLLRLGETLGALGRRDESCAAFAEFRIRFPAAAPSLAARAASAARRGRCP
jgi:TolA-binding protein